MSSAVTVKQVTQRLRDGAIEVLDVPPPALRPEGVLVDVRASLLSAGTERSKVETGRQSLVGKARARPDQVRQVVDKARRDGVRETVQAVRTRLDQPSGLGYSAAGIVLEVGSRVSDLVPGDRVACGGGDYAMHAEVDYVPGNLCVRAPSKVEFAEAAFATVGSIAMHGVRQADVRLGERVAVIGLGLVGQLAGQLLRASGCFVMGVDRVPSLVERALENGAADVAYERALLDEAAVSGKAGSCDAVIITAATKSSDPVELAARLCRDRGRVVVVGDVGMEIPRAAYYEKEIELRLSRSYGPGRYDRQYEERGLDYPVGYVRWTERRNMGAFLDLVAAGKINVKDLISERVAVDEAPQAYERLISSERSPLGIVIEYPTTELTNGLAMNGRASEKSLDRRRNGGSKATVGVGVIGAGSFAQRILIPGLAKAGFGLVSVASEGGVSAHAAAERFGFERAATADEVIADPSIDLVAIATRHSSHARLAAAALRAGKSVFVEKPPCLSFDELKDLRAAEQESDGLLTVGFNRRHAPLATALRAQLAERHGPLSVLYRVCAGPLPADHWLNDIDEGGGRLLGEGCHFVDFCCWLAGSVPERIFCSAVCPSGQLRSAASGFTIAIEFPGGSAATIVYTAEGSRGVGKEYVEVHTGGTSMFLDDLGSLRVDDDGRVRRTRKRGRDKGHVAQFHALRRALDPGEQSEAIDQLDTTFWTLLAVDSARAGKAIS